MIQCVSILSYLNRKMKWEGIWVYKLLEKNVVNDWEIKRKRCLNNKTKGIY